MRRQLALIIAVSLVGGCEFFDSDDDDDDDFGETGGDGDGDEELPPSQGFRVLPKFMLQDLPAIVTIDIDGPTPTPCKLDQAPEGGYVCDAGALPANGAATIRVDKDGFATAWRYPTVVLNQIVALEVHLIVEGGPTGSWSACAVVGEFETCAELCAGVEGECAVTSCATEQDEWPVATFQTFTDAECSAPIENLALACETPLPQAGTVGSLRCCCAG